MKGILGDVRLALRRVAGSPGLTALIVLTFALGIGANTAVFSLFDQVLLRSMPVKDPGRLVIIDTPGPNSGLFESNKNFPSPISYPMFKDFRDKSDVFDGVLAYLPTSIFLGVDKSTERVSGNLVSGSFFEVLGLQPAKGRLISAADDITVGGHPVVVISHSYWERRFGSDPSIIGKSVRVNAASMEIVGVAPANFRGLEVGEDVQAYVSLTMKKAVTPTWDELESRRAMFLTPVARLKPGITMAQAQTRLDVLYKQILAEEMKLMTSPRYSDRFRQRFTSKSIALFPGGAGASALREQTEAPFKVLLATASLVLFIGCLNIANLLLTRATKRRKEIAVRLSLGGTRSRLVRELLVEGAVLASLGLIAGLFVAVAGGHLLVNTLPDPDARALLSFSLDARVLGFAALLAFLGVLISSILPALQGTRVALTPSLREGSGATAAGGRRTRNGLVIGQLALSLALLVGAGLLARSLFNLASRPVGYDTEHVVSFGLNPALAGYDEAQKRSLFDRVAEEIAAQPSVASVGMSDNSLLTNSNSSSTIKLPGYTPAEEEDMNPLWMEVTPDFFKTIQATLISGRGVEARDGKGAPLIAVVNESFAKHFFKGKDAVGQRFGKNRGDDFPIEIVGVVKDLRMSSVNELEGRRHIFIASAQVQVLGAATFYVRARGSEAGLIETVRGIVTRIDPSVPPTHFTTLAQTRADSIAAERTMAYLATVFGAIALLLAALGLYGVLSHGVTQRFREIGVRVAIGAQPRDIVQLILGQAGRLVVGGLLLGVPIAAGVAMLVRSQLFGVPSFDAVSIGVSLIVLAGSAILAAYLPANRAARIDPSKTLRHE
ncbi:MAG: ABC transporter permease [Vicinamibacteria bacterium]